MLDNLESPTAFLISYMENLGATVKVTGHYEVTVTEVFPVGHSWVGHFTNSDELEALIEALTSLLRAIAWWRKYHPGYGSI